MPFLASQGRRLSSLLIPTLVLVVIISEVLNTTIYSERELRDMRESAVAMASLGQFESALDRLRALTEVAPNDTLVWGDYLTVLVRANQADTAFELYRDDPARALPDYAYAEMFAAALARGDVTLARELADREIAQSPDAVAVSAARELALAAVNPEPAQQTIAATPAPAPPAPPAPVPVTTPPPQPEPLAPVAQELPENPVTTPTTPADATTPALADADVPEQAVQPSPPPEVNTTPAQADAISQPAEIARQAVRDAEMATPEQRIDTAARALVALDAYAAALTANNGSAVELRNEKLDRVRALTLANRLDEARALFEALGEPQTLPVFGLLNGADLYIRLEQPDEAARLLDLAAQQEPDNRGVLLTRFYLELNRENYEEAATVVASLQRSASTPQEQREARMLDAQLAAYSNRLQKAQRELELLAAEDPDSADLRQRLAQIYRWRGWPRRALEEYRKAENLAGEPGTAQLGAVSALVDMHSYMEAQVTLTEVARANPQHPELAAARSERQQRQRMEYRAQVSVGNSSDSPVTGAGNITLDQRLISAPIAENFRLFVHQRYDWADFREGDTGLHRVGVGVDYRSRYLDAQIEINQRNRNGDLGVNLSGEFHFDDRFTAFGDFSSDSSAAPLRGVGSGVRGNSRGVGLLFRAHESSQTTLRYSLADLSDGNEREAFTLRQQNSWFLNDRRRLRLTAEAYYGNSSADDNLLYYNPTGEKAATLTLEYTAPIPVGADREWFQRFAAGAGAYEQEGFGSSAIWDFEYEQILRLDDALELNYGLLYRSRVYAGDREGYTALFGGLVWRF